MNGTQTAPTASGWPQDWKGTAATPISVDEAFNGYLAAQIVFALDRLGLLDQLLELGEVDVREFAARSGADHRMLHELLRAAETCGYVAVREGLAALTLAGREMARVRGYFTWAVGGYTELFANIADIATGKRRFNHDVLRNEAMVALGSAQNDQAQLADTLDGVLADLDFTTIADLGSGISARVCRVAASREGVRGVGLDISASANRLAAETIRRAGLNGRVTALHRDILDLVSGREHDAVLHEVDAVMSFFLMHDLLADPNTRPQVLPRLREVFPKAHTFILADTMLRPADAAGATLPVFSVGYELAHAIMGVPLHTQDAYEALFAQAGMCIRQVIPFGTPHSWLYVLEAD